MDQVTQQYGQEHGQPQQYGQEQYGQEQQYGQAQDGQDPQYGQPSPYGQQQPMYSFPPSRPTNVMAILALVFCFVFAPVGLILGIVARKKIQETGEEGHGLALAGIIVGAIFTGLYLLYLIVVVVAVVASASA